MSRAFRSLPVGVLLLAFLLAGCDAVDDLAGNNTLTLPPISVTFRFAGNAPGGGDLTFVSSVQEDLADELRANGSQKGEVVGATLRSATVTRIQPVGQNLSALMNSAELWLAPSGGSLVSVGTMPSPPADDEGSFSLADRDLASIITAPQFGAELALRGLAPGTTYVFEVTLDLRVVVEGI